MLCARYRVQKDIHISQGLVCAQCVCGVSTGIEAWPISRLSPNNQVTKFTMPRLGRIRGEGSRPASSHLCKARMPLPRGAWRPTQTAWGLWGPGQRFRAVRHTCSHEVRVCRQIHVIARLGVCLLSQHRLVSLHFQPCTPNPKLSPSAEMTSESP
jgi:hypothetical protein